MATTDASGEFQISAEPKTQFVMYAAASGRHLWFWREMVAQVKSTLAERGCHRLTLYVGQDNLAVVPFYERLGFEHNKVLSMGIDLLNELRSKVPIAANSSLIL